MEYCIDYLSFTVPFNTIDKVNTHLIGPMAEAAVSEFLGELIDAVLDNQPFSVLRGRAPYLASWGRADGGVRIFSAPQISHVLVEITGTGCKTLREHQKLDALLLLVKDRVSRIDLACDIVCRTAPHTFAEYREVERFKTITDWRSETGDTFYVGSMRSDRYARVYRFAEPHPRADKLRVEHVFRREAAKAFTRGLLDCGYAASVRAAGDIYGWSHPQWQPDNVAAAAITSGQTRRSNKNTVGWLYGAVTTSIVKAVIKNELDLDNFIDHLRQMVDSATISEYTCASASI